jgi:hypothetical protein
MDDINVMTPGSIETRLVDGKRVSIQVPIPPYQHIMTMEELVKAEGFTMDDALSELAALVREAEPEGEGWYTTRQIADAAGVSIQAATRRLERSLRLGEVEKFSGMKEAYWRKKLKAPD